VLHTIDGVSDARLEQVDAVSIFTVNPKPVMLARYGLDVTDLHTCLHLAIGGKEAGQIFEGDRRFSLIVRFDENIRPNLDTFADITIVTNNGEYIPLAEVAELNFTSVPSQISRENGKRRVIVTANVRERD
jgi:cobalt-zinc-cadmium resistance protein CzcA